MGYLDETTRRRVAAILLGVVVVVVALAVADLGPFSDPPTEEERAQESVESFFAAGADGDFKTFCTKLTKPARAGLESQGASLAAQQDLKGCDEILAALVGKQLKDSELKVTDVSVSGNRGRVVVNLKVPDSRGHAQATVLLEETDGEWLISDPGFG